MRRWQAHPCVASCSPSSLCRLVRSLWEKYCLEGEKQGEATLSVRVPGCPGPPRAQPTAQDPRSPACWMREAGVEATGSAALRSRLAVAPVGGPGGRARVADPRSCPILSSRSCSRRSRSTSSGFRAAPCGDEMRPGQACEVMVLGDPAFPQRRAWGKRLGGHLGKMQLRNPLVQPPPHKAGSPRGLEMTPNHTVQRNKATQPPGGRRKLGLRSRARSLCPGLMGLRQSWEG